MTKSPSPEGGLKGDCPPIHPGGGGKGGGGNIAPGGGGGGKRPPEIEADVLCSCRKIDSKAVARNR